MLSELPPPGTAAFLPALLARARTARIDAATALPIDAVIVNAILLCLVAGDSHLVLLTQPDDISLVLKLTALTLQYVFALPTHRTRIRADSVATTDPANFLRAIFLPDSPPRRRSRSQMLLHARSYSTPTDLNRLSPPTPTSPLPSPLRPRTGHANTEPAVPAPAIPPLPHALVLAGVEHVSAPAQRALLAALRAHAVDFPGAVAPMPLPPDFFLVCVCAADPRAPPPLNDALLDRFAMSAPVSLAPPTRHAARALAFPATPRAHPSHSPAPSLPPALPASPRARAAPLPPPPPATPLPPGLLPALRALHARTRLRAPLALLRADLLAAARHHPRLDGTRVGLRAGRDAEALARAARVLGIGADAAPGGGGDTSTEGSAGAEADIDPADVDVDSDWGFEEGGEAAEEAEADPDAEWAPAYLDVSEADIARIVPRVLTHRLRVREGPREEVLASAVFGAVSHTHGEPGMDVGDREGRADVTVLDVLVDILADV